ncbi:MAG TPA: methylated-DNA--[protein]-cysteine S-methyltransferase [Solirubrobacteraceae bacterium]
MSAATHAATARGGPPAARRAAPPAGGHTATHPRALAYATHATGAGPFTILADGDGVVRAAGWTTDPVALAGLVAPSLRVGVTPRARRDIGVASRALRDYLAGDVGAIDDVPVRQASGPVVERGWAALRALPAGAPITYAELAARCGRPGAARAAAAACGRNAVALFVPCHRVVRTGGALGGYRWGLDVKRWLLAHEAGWAAGS